jgi:pimeloyl-ACP methyl ester carboxylesterase
LAAGRIEMDLITVRAADGTPLDGVLYTRKGDERPAAQRTVVNFLHGRSMNFSVGVQRFAAPGLAATGFDVLALNRRSAGVAGIRDSFQGVGDAWTRWAEHRMDVEAAVRHLTGLGYRRIVMAGHSQGGLLAADYAAKDPEVAGLILASPAPTFAGLPSTFGDARRTEFTARAQALVAQGREKELLLLPDWPWIISAQVAVDHLTPGLVIALPDLVARYAGPLLVFCGDTGHDARLFPGARAAFQRSPSPAKRLEPITGCDHFYVDHEARVTVLIKAWLLRHVPPA